MPLHRRSMDAKAKKVTNPPEGPTCASRFSEDLSRINPIPFACDVVSPCAHITPSLVHGLHVGRAQHVIWHQATLQGFSFLPNSARLPGGVEKHRKKLLPPLDDILPKRSKFDRLTEVRGRCWGLAQGATTRTGAAAAGEQIERLVAATNQTETAGGEQARRPGQVKAGSGLKRVAAVRNGGA